MGEPGTASSCPGMLGLAQGLSSALWLFGIHRRHKSHKSFMILMYKHDSKQSSKHDCKSMINKSGPVI